MKNESLEAVREREREREPQFSKINRNELKVEIPLFVIKEDRTEVSDKLKQNKRNHISCVSSNNYYSCDTSNS